MFPSKSMADYKTEMNRLFRTQDNDMFQLHPNPYSMMSQTPFNQTANKSSSSADSTSPESFPDLTASFQPEYRHDIPRYIFDQPICETPKPESQFLVRRQRPIIGRKYITPEHYTETLVAPTKMAEDLEFPPSIWQDDGFQHTPPNTTSFMEQKAFTTNVYELFPTENRGYEFSTPIKSSSSNISPTLSNISPNISNASPSFSSISPSKFSSPSQSFNISPPFAGRNVGPIASKYSHDIRPPKMCTFCRKNGETPIVYMDHCVRERVGNKSVVTCPILRSHVCSTCGATGDLAHTITYCPVLRSSNNGLPLQSTTITLKNTRIKSNGRRRY